MLVNTPAIVISTLKYGEADLIARCYTLSSGLKSYLLRGILKSRKGKLRTAMFQPLTQLEIEAFHKDKGTLERIREAKVLQPYQTLHTDVVKTSIVMFLSEVLRLAIQEEEQNERLYHFLAHGFQWLDTHDRIANFHLFFLLQLTQYLGFYPDDSESNFPAFNLEAGQFVPEDSSPLTIGLEETTTLKLLLGINFDDLEHVKLNQHQRARFLNVLIEYYMLHLHGFKKPRSLAVLQSIFH
ncbi:DNA repair protein RecO [Croceiramulus getboli]|nr:DNA repair protein RecO [Flavobacteriaceae bacterium YJPT1-3]